MDHSEWNADLKSCPNGTVLVCYKSNSGKNIVDKGHNMSGYFSVGDYYSSRISPTHWMEWPEAPPETED